MHRRLIVPARQAQQATDLRPFRVPAIWVRALVRAIPVRAAAPATMLPRRTIITTPETPRVPAILVVAATTIAVIHITPILLVPHRPEVSAHLQTVAVLAVRQVRIAAEAVSVADVVNH